MATLGEELPREMTRVRTEVLPAYYKVLKHAPMTRLAIDLMNASLDAAQKAISEGDSVAMIQAYEDLKGYKL